MMDCVPCSRHPSGEADMQPGIKQYHGVWREGLVSRLFAAQAGGLEFDPSPQEKTASGGSYQ